jgi:hypothetical protein
MQEYCWRRDCQEIFRFAHANLSQTRFSLLWIRIKNESRVALEERSTPYGGGSDEERNASDKEEVSDSKNEEKKQGNDEKEQNSSEEEREGDRKIGCERCCQ